MMMCDRDDNFFSEERAIAKSTYVATVRTGGYKTVRVVDTNGCHLFHHFTHHHTILNINFRDALIDFTDVYHNPQSSQNKFFLCGTTPSGR